MGQKGQQYERQICTDLSRWWTGGTRDDVFWRTSGSGARAISRHGRGQKTAGQFGDVAATDPIGQPLIDFFTIEIKRGYSAWTVADILDVPTRKDTCPQKWEEWVQEVYEHHQAAGTPFWMLIQKRDQRPPIVFMPADVTNYLECSWKNLHPFFGIHARIQFREGAYHKIKHNGKAQKRYIVEREWRVGMHLIGMLFEDFLDRVQKIHILSALSEVKRENLIRAQPNIQTAAYVEGG
jgi:hypothetical protein